mmetsp:Transcript_19348/g.53936  ORF Transcript_19348/g.53936 Transcript_19348/m.53936 type:complete len:276 (+) Transcript_19348:406-1233(+)
MGGSQLVSKAHHFARPPGLVAFALDTLGNKPGHGVGTARARTRARTRVRTRKRGYRWSSELHYSAAAIEPPPPVRIHKITTAVYALILASALSFVGDNILGLSFFRKNLYLCHWKWKWWQPLTSTFCHGDRAHLSGNAFLLLLFGRSVEDELGASGLVFSYVFCGVVANLVSLVLLPTNTVSIGASGAVFGLFSVSILARLSWRDVLDWRKIIEVGVLGQFVVSQFLSEAKTAASGGIVGINHVAHLSGAAAGCAMVLMLRLLIRIMENNTKTNS